MFHSHPPSHSSPHTRTHTHPPPSFLSTPPPPHPPTHPPTNTQFGVSEPPESSANWDPLAVSLCRRGVQGRSREEPSQCWWQGQHVVHVEPTSRVWKLWKDSFQRVSETLMRHAGVASSALPGVLLWFVLESLEWPSQPYRSLHPIDSCSVRSDTGNGGKILTGQARVRCPTHLNDGSLNQKHWQSVPLACRDLGRCDDGSAGTAAVSTGSVRQLRTRPLSLRLSNSGAANSKLQGCRSQKDACAFERSLFVKKKS